MARSPQRQAFQPANNEHRQELDTSKYPERVSIDLDNEDPNNFEIVEISDIPEDDRGHDDTDPATWGDANSQDPRGVGPRTEKRIGRLKAETETQRRLREAAERERDAAVDLAQRQAVELADLRRRGETGSAALAASMKSEREARLADARRRLSQAHADGDSEAIAEATADMGMAQAELAQIAARTPPPRTEEQRREEPRQQAPQQRAPELAPNVAAWLGHHNGWFNKDKAKTDLAMSIHRAAMARGVDVNSEQYTQELDRGLKAVYPDHQPYSGSRSEDGNEGGGRSTPRRSNAVAEGSRESGRPSNPRTVELTSSELAVAKHLNLTPQQYAASKLKHAQRTGA